MAERRVEFEKQFQLLWKAGPTGISVFYVTTESRAAGNRLVADLLSETLIADEEQRNPDVSQYSKLQRHFITHPINFPTEVEYRSKNHRIMGVTSDIRVAELIERTASHHSLGSDKIPFDMVIVSMANAAPDYVEWVKLQTMKKDSEKAFFNIEPEAEMHGLDNKIAELEVAE